MSNENTMEKIVSLCKRRGFIFQSSEIYGGLNSLYDYGPLGVELKNNVKQAWRREMVQNHRDIFGLDSAILMHPKVWEASGHLEGFTDLLVDCKKCKKRFRADHLLEAKGVKPSFRPGEIKKHKVDCPECGGELTEEREFNLMFKTYMGAVEEEAHEIYLRPETAQGIYVNFENIRETTRAKLPFGVAQIGKAFRNEITPGNFIFRTREFEQMEMQWFCEKKEADKWFDKFQRARMNWYLNLGIKKENLRFREHNKNELAHYAKKALDIEYRFPFAGIDEFTELEGIHNRGDWDLSRHEKYSGQDLKYFDDQSKNKFIPWIIETSGGVDRATLAFLIDAYTEVDARSGDKDAKHEKEIVLRLHKDLAPIKIAILPLSKKEPLKKLAGETFDNLKAKWMCQYDETGSIGKRYRRHDEIGTPYCLTVDFESLADGAVTIRDRDTMKQERIKIEELMNYFLTNLN